MKYSQRILKTADLLEKGSQLADIGCDHGYMCILAVNSGRFPKAYACDVAEGPLSRAKENIEKQGLSDAVIPILSDGFENVPDDIDCSVICGMGGMLILRILDQGIREKKHLGQLVLGPHSELKELREFIQKRTDFAILRETSLKDAGKHYMLMDLRRKSLISEMILHSYDSETNLAYGNPANQTDPAAYADYLLHEKEKLESALQKTQAGKGNRASDRQNELKTQLSALQQLINQTEETVPWVYTPTMNTLF